MYLSYISISLQKYEGSTHLARRQGVLAYFVRILSDTMYLRAASVTKHAHITPKLY